MMGILGSVFIIYWLFGDISMMESPEALFGWLNKLFSDSDAYLIISSVSYAVMPLIYYLSYRISCKLYKKGAESFER